MVHLTRFTILGSLLLLSSAPADVAPVSESTLGILAADVLTTEAVPHRGSQAINGNQSVTITDLTVSDGTDDLALIDGYLTSRSFTVRNEGNFLRHHLSFNAKVAPRELTDNIDSLSTNGTGNMSFTFEITDQPMDVSLGLDFANLSSPELTLSGSTGDIFRFPNPENSYGFSGTLPPGTYTFSASSLSLPSSTASLNQAEFAASIAIGEEPPAAPLPTPGSYTHPDIVTAHSGSGILQIQNPQILSEVDLGNGLTQLEVSASVQNLYACPWPEVNLTLSEEHPDGPNLQIITPLPTFSLAPNQVGGPPTGSTLIAQVATSEVETLRAQILDATRFQSSGLEQPVFNYPVRPLEADDFPNSPADNPAPAGLAFSYLPLLPSGFTILEWESYYQVPRVTVIDNDGQVTTIAWQQGVDRYFPLIVEDVERIGTTFHLSFHEEASTLADVMKEGNVTTTLTPEGHPENWGVTNVPETHNTSSGFGLTGFFPSPIPFHFNEVELPGGIRFSGSLGFYPELFEVELDHA